MTTPHLQQDLDPNTDRVADAPPDNWVDLYAPRAIRPYLRLARADRPIGTWLLVFPCWWSMALATIAEGQTVGQTVDQTTGQTSLNLWYALLFLIGAFVMRGAGCAYNDYVDREFDAQVARTRSRPIPSGQVKPSRALMLVGGLSLIGLAVLVQFNAFTIALGIGSLALVLIYPFMKRMTYWPQVVLGLAFNWGALVGWSAITGSLDWPALLLYAGAVAWTVGYDTIYAHQDKEDDLMLGLKSTAIRFGDRTKPWIGGLYAATLSAWLAATLIAGAGPFTLLALTLMAMALIWQVVTLETTNPDNCLKRFKANRDVGALFFAGLVLDVLV